MLDTDCNKVYTLHQVNVKTRKNCYRYQGVPYKNGCQGAPKTSLPLPLQPGSTTVSVNYEQ